MIPNRIVCKLHNVDDISEGAFLISCTYVLLSTIVVVKNLQCMFVKPAQSKNPSSFKRFAVHISKLENLETNMKIKQKCPVFS